MARYNFRNFKFYSITTLPDDVKQHIFDKMSYSDGGMQRLLQRNPKRVRVCLVYYRRQLVAWAAVELDRTTVGWCEYKRPSVTAWTSRKFRGKGCASSAIRQLLRRHRRQLRPQSPITVYHPKIRAIVNDCGFKGRLVEWTA